MAYSHPSSLDIEPEQTYELEIGAYLDRVLSYLRTLLPSEQGRTTARTT